MSEFELREQSAISLTKLREQSAIGLTKLREQSAISLTNLRAQGVGRRKKASATVLFFLPSGRQPAGLREVGGEIIVNNRTAEEYFQYNLTYLKNLRAPLVKTELTYDIIVKVYGGGLTGQATAIQLGIARALIDGDLHTKYNRKILKGSGFLRCDSRVKERKKYGLKKARKASQFSKR
jgi:small subunit ribosomal protein S9